MRIRKLQAIGALALVVVLGACSGGDSTTDTGASAGGTVPTGTPIKLGGLLDETGAAAPNGTAALRGAQLAIEEVNAAGGIKGRPVQLDQQDPAFDTGQATALLQRFVGDSSVVALLGPNSDTVSTPLTKPINDAKIVSIITSGAGGRPNSEFGRYMFSVPVRNDFIINKIAPALAEEKLTKVAIVYSTSRPFAATARDYFIEAAKKSNLTIVSQPHGFADKDVDFSALITQLRNDNPDAIFCSCLANAAGPMIKQASTVGLKARWVSDASLLDPNFYTLSNNTADGTIVATPFDTTRDDKVVKDFVASFTKKFNQAPTVYDAYGYDSALVLIRAMQSITGDITRESVRDAVSKVSFNGATGRVSFPDGQGVAARNEVFVVQMKGGAFVPLD